MKHSQRYLAAALVVLITAGGAAGVLAANDEFAVQFDNLMVLDTGVDGVYEGWAIIGGAPFSTGVFNVDEMGNTVDPDTGVPIPIFVTDLDLDGTTDIKISIEPVGDMDPGPSGLIVLTGAVVDNAANLVPALPGYETLAAATGNYILASPSDNAEDDMNDDQGIWFLCMPGPVAGLVGLPDLGPSWTYEGWVVDVSGAMPVPYSTGTFDTAAGFDSDEAGTLGGGPPFPGQDFVAYQGGPVLDLDSGDFAAVLSIEPVPDNGPGPFLFKPMAGAIPTDALGMCNALGNQVDATFPTGSAQLGDPLPAEELSWGELKNAYR